MAGKNIGVFCLLERDGELLLVKKNYGNLSWMLPGGAVESGEGTCEALRREVKEETGQTISNIQFVAAFYSRDHYSMALCFRAELVGGDDLSFTPQEIADVRFFPLEALPTPMSPRYKRWIEFCQQNRGLVPENMVDFE